MKLGLLLLLMACCVCPAWAQSPGTFTATGRMTTPRSFHQATLLTDGRVLMTGGDVNIAIGSSLIPTASAELYDPASGTFTATGNMTAARLMHTATLLPDGRVLITGGDAGGSQGTSAELYDPTTRTFAPIGSMASSHSRATLLNNGMVLLTGGFGQGQSSPAPNPEIYDPVTGTFTAANAYLADTAGLITANLLADGKVLVTGCTLCDGDDADLAQLYDPALDAFSPTAGTYHSAFPSGLTSTLLTNGKVLFAGGANEDFWAPDSDLYDPLTGTFARTGDMKKPRDNHAAALLADGSVLITGARLDYMSHASDGTAELYDAATGSWGMTGNMTTARGYHTATLLADGRVLVTGGAHLNVLKFPSTVSTLSSAEVYNPASALDPPSLFAALHATTHLVVSADNPATSGEALELYGSGLIDGAVIPPQITIGRQLAKVLYFGNTPGNPQLSQINVRVPDGITPGPAVPVRMNYLSRPSNEVMVAIQ